MLLAIDIGNTRIKAAVFEDNTLLEIFIFTSDEWVSKVENILFQYPKIAHFAIASVGNLDKTAFLPFENRVKIGFISHDSLFPFQNLYSTPKTLGIDRMVLSTAAVLQFPNQNRLVIDAGTCITYDFIDRNDNYLGGAISPGIRLRYESLNQQTAKLPLLEKKYPENLIGNSTHESIHSGIINGVLLEIDGFIELYKEKHTDITIILTGGDADFLAMRLKNPIFASSNFLLEGLNRTYQFNQK